MGRIRIKKDPDRYLTLREGNYYYKRRVPQPMVGIDTRGSHVRISLKTDDLAQARSMRDIYESADDEYWASLHSGGEKDNARARYMAAIVRAQSLGFSYRPAAEVAKESIDEILQRIEAVANPQTVRPLVQAVIGTVPVPAVTVSEAFKVYTDEIAAHEIAGKSPTQKRRWESNKQLSVDNFVEVVGDLNIDAVDRDDARTYYRHWRDRIAPKTGKPTHSPSHGNRMIGNLRVLFQSYFAHIGQNDRQNPFDRLRFNERKKRKRPPFDVGWITDKLLKSGALAGLNKEARGIVLTMVESGARPSEICNLSAELIVLEHPIPHLRIEPRDDPDDPREIKTQSSIRMVPLVGVALEAMKANPQGFPRYKDKEDSLSAALNKFFRENALFPTPKHTIYSLRHSMEDRMKEANLDAELRRIIMGHAIDRPDYGEGGSLAWRQEQLKKIELPFDSGIV